MFRIGLAGLALLMVVAETAQAQDEVVSLGLGINSEYDEYNAHLTADGQSIYFVRANHPENKFGKHSQDIWWAKAAPDASWQTATRLEALNIAQYNSILDLSENGKTMLLNGVFNKKGTLWKKRGLSISNKVGDTWSTPVSLKVNALGRKNSGTFSGGDMSADGMAIVMAFSKAYNGKKSDIYIMTKTDKGAWRAPKKLHALNSGQTDEAPTFSADGSAIYFSSNRNGGYSIYQAVKKGKDWDEWSAPELLRGPANTSAWDSYYRIAPDGQWAYYASTRGQAGNADIYRLPSPMQRKKVWITGKAIHERTGETVTRENLTVLTNGEKPDSLMWDAPSGTYRFLADRNKEIEIVGLLEGFVATPLTVFAEADKKDVDLLLNLVPVAHITGRLLVRSTGKPLSAAAEAIVLIDDAQVDSLVVNTEEATYQVAITPGKKYKFTLKATGYEPAPVELDLSKENQVVERTVDLFVDLPAVFTLQGKILDKQTGEPLQGTVVEMDIKQLPDVSIVVDSLSGQYLIKLPPGKKYGIHITAEGYFPTTVDVSGSEGSVVERDVLMSVVKEGGVVAFHNILFVKGRAHLLPTSQTALSSILEFMEANPKAQLLISGHTDNTGPKELNQRLSEERANAVSDYLIEHGVGRRRLSTKGFGIEKPIADNSTKEGRNANRRVEITIQKL